MQSPSKISSASVSTAPAMSELQRWADLPEGLLDSIIALLGSFLDILAFAGTCRSWRTAFASYPSKSTFRALLPPLRVRPSVLVCAPRLPSSHDGHKLHTCQVIDPANPNTALRCQIPQVNPQKLHFVGSSYGQLICGGHQNCLVVDVFTGAKVSPPHLPFSESEGTDFYCGMLTAPLASSGSHLLVCAQSKLSSTQSSLLDWPVGSDSWSELRLDGSRINQIVDFNGQLIVMDDYQKLYILHLAPQLRLQEIANVWCLNGCRPLITPWLVVCGDMLLIVDPYINILRGSPVYYEAYRLDMSTKPATWVELRKLENYALFVGRDLRSPPFSCMSPGRWGGRSNCLYYAHHTRPWSLHRQRYETDYVWDPSTDRDLFMRQWYSKLQPLWMYPSMFY